MRVMRPHDGLANCGAVPGDPSPQQRESPCRGPRGGRPQQEEVCQRVETRRQETQGRQEECPCASDKGGHTQARGHQLP
ncbi:MAG: hypothetical protein BJ554DRAFT_5525 [Olpidium bornovanus]|uniref:Uncharacterized protein n=1 Tax=Olpidium bornovanus TaxID=278681 RepID=A0A8H7ZZF0_9FUNG|nr:MAG: hypothetical protein BJ554DRAFT_5525 [Olpidium bornovanus]